MDIAIIDSNCANAASVQFAIERLGHRAFLTQNFEQIQSADRVILPGVGSASAAMKSLHENELISVLRNLEQPVMGICLGMQLFLDYSEENDTPCLSILPGRAEMFCSDNKFRIPHMGWNTLSDIDQDDPVCEGIREDSYVYFVHSYFIAFSSMTLAQTNYIANFSAMVRRQNYWGCQFHPERSGPIGARILQNFVGLSC